MKFSIIIPVLNEEKTIVDSLKLLQSWRKNCDIIVVDGGSKDSTQALARPLCDQLLSSPVGRALQMNLGAQHAKGNVLIFLHADTHMPPLALNAIDQSIRVERQWGRFDIQISGKHWLLNIVAKFMNWRSWLTGIATGDQVIFVNKQLFDLVGQYPAIALMEDIALCKKLKQVSPPICLSTKVVSSGRRWEQFGILKTILLMWSLRLRYFFGTHPDELALAYKKGQIWKT